MSARNHEAVTAAVDRIDRALANSPNGVGESRPDGYRILIELPLVVYYQVVEGNRLVRVLRLLASRTLL
jgi:plasmid stabilization system protein ParE